MLGLLGTIAGLIEAFQSMTNASGLTSSAEISNGIYQALITTAAGLAVCIPTALAYAYVDSRVKTTIHDIERAVATADLEARGQTLHIPLPRSGEGLVEVVDVEDHSPFGCAEQAEV